MNSRTACIAAILIFPFLSGAQEQAVIPLNSEPHHHLVLHNDYVNVYSVQVSPHDSVLLHKHEADAISIVLGDSSLVVGAPGKPDSHVKVVDGQLRLQSASYVHSTLVDGDLPYRNVTVEFLQPQQTPQNLCAAVIVGQPLNCPDPPAQHRLSDQPQFETKQTKLTLIHVPPHQSATLDPQPLPQLIVALDDVNLSGNGVDPGKSLHAGDALWRDSNTAARDFRNDGSKDARLVSFAFQLK